VDLYGKLSGGKDDKELGIFVQKLFSFPKSLENRKSESQSFSTSSSVSCDDIISFKNSLKTLTLNRIELLDIFLSQNINGLFAVDEILK
jgi:hypothetical protein